MHLHRSSFERWRRVDTGGNIILVPVKTPAVLTEPSPPTKDELASRTPADHTKGVSLVVDAGRAFEDHYEFVWRVLACAGIPRERVDDAVQDVFLTVHRRRETYDGRAPVRHWIYGIARCVARNHRRALFQASRRSDPLPMLSRAPEQEQSLEHTRTMAALQRFLAELNPDQREVFVLSCLEGMTAPEIAEMTGVSVNTVYSRLRLTRERLEQTVARDPKTQRDHG